jgi:hypothetical protein
MACKWQINLSLIFQNTSVHCRTLRPSDPSNTVPLTWHLPLISSHRNIKTFIIFHLI